MKCTLVTPLMNEIEGIEDLWNAITGQTRQPDEWIITDNGSTDGTYEWLQEKVAKSPFKLRVLCLPKKTIAEMMNQAIREAANDVIASCHAGIIIPENWLENLLLPLENGKAEVVAGAWKAVGETDFARWYSKLIDFDIEKVDEEAYLPATRSMVFTRQAWEKCQGLPEWLPLFGEDTLFAIRLKYCGYKFAVCKEPVVGWHPKPTLKLMMKQERRYSEASLIMGYAKTNWRVFLKPWGFIPFAILYYPFLENWGLSLISALFALIFLDYILKTRRRKQSLKDFVFLKWFMPLVWQAAAIRYLWWKHKLKIKPPEFDQKAVAFYREKFC